MSEEKKRNPLISYIIIAIVVAGGLLLYAKKDKLRDDKHYTIFFNDVEGLTVASKVSINGAVVGKVSAAELMSKDVIKVTIAIKKKVDLPKGTTAKLASAGMARGEEIRLILGTSKEVLADNGIINGINSKKPMGNNGSIRSALRLGKIALRTTDSIITEMSTFLDAATKRDLRFQLNDLNVKSKSASKTAIEIRGTGDELISKIRETNKTVAGIADKSKEWPKMMADGEKQTAELVQSTADIENNLKELQANLKKFKSVSDKLKDENSALGKLLNDKQNYNTPNRSADTLKGSIDHVMKHPSAHWFAIFGSNSVKE
jgi:ABC-type transporter Mla subunit MlaD